MTKDEALRRLKVLAAFAADGTGLITQHEYIAKIYKELKEYLDKDPEYTTVACPACFVEDENFKCSKCENKGFIFVEMKKVVDKTV